MDSRSKSAPLPKRLGFARGSGLRSNGQFSQHRHLRFEVPARSVVQLLSFSYALSFHYLNLEGLDDIDKLRARCPILSSLNFRLARSLGLRCLFQFRLGFFKMSFPPFYNGLKLL